MVKVKNLNWVDLSILLVALIMMIFGIGNYGLYEPHESHFAMVGYEMVLRRDVVSPTLNGAPYLNKPPLLYWLIAASIYIFGNSEFAVRLPLAIAGWLGIAIAFCWTRQLWGVKASRIAVLMLSVTFGWFIFTRQLLIEVLLATLLLASNYFLWRLLSQPHSRFYFFAVYLSLGLSVLAKGPIGIIFLLFNWFILSSAEQSWQLWQKIKLGRGILVVLAVILPWFIAVERANPGFIYYFIFNEHINRLLDIRFPPDYEVSKISAIGYLGITAVWCLPWIACLPQVISFTWRDWQDSKDKHYKQGILLLAIAAIIPIIFFLPLSSRLIYYSIPAIPSYVILCAGWWSQLKQNSNKKSLIILEIVFIALGMCLIGIIFFFPNLLRFLSPIENRIDISRLIVVTSIPLGLAWLIAGMAMLRERLRLSLISLSIGFALTCASSSTAFTLYQYVHSSKILVQTASPCLNINTLWVFEGSRQIGTAGGISYYLNQGKNYSRPKIFGVITSLPTGWVRGRQDLIYRQVMILADGGRNRLPPNFPGSPPSYLISKQQLHKYWNSDRPVVFVTDFLRQPNDPKDPPDLNLPEDAGKPLLAIGQRRMYGNHATRKFWCSID
ncbi:glycosyltransferase family 39 protein [Pleurocapsales cyanobacterium LEGE 06147]|nr:glycosyltransferase family 39 protein [Pleurocapsales cyanobacterium LEGE 06147]